MYRIFIKFMPTYSAKTPHHHHQPCFPRKLMGSVLIKATESIQCCLYVHGFKAIIWVMGTLSRPMSLREADLTIPLPLLSVLCHF